MMLQNRRSYAEQIMHGKEVSPMKARFHLPDFAGHFKFNLVFTGFFADHPEYFREGVEIASVYGSFPQSMWNGGRTQPGFCDLDFVKGVLHAFNKRGIPLRFTFTNPLIEKRHLYDDFCNNVMQLADNGMNEVIVMSPVLEAYIREKYPNFKITSSTCKRITDGDELMQEFEKDYHIIVIDYDLNHDLELLGRLPDKKKCELLVNACCNPACQMRSEHYRVIGLQQIAYSTHINKYHGRIEFDYDKLLAEHPEIRKFEQCPCADRSLFEVKKLKNHITPDEIWNTYIPMGFEQFKIEGRTSPLLNLMEHYLYYMIKPECMDEAHYVLLKYLAANGVMTFNE